MSGVVACWRCGKRFPVTATACPNCGEANVLEPKDLDPPAPPRVRFVLGVLAAVLVAALLAFLWVVWTVAAQ